MTNQNQQSTRESDEIGERERFGNAIITWNTKGEVIDIREYSLPKPIQPRGKILYVNFQRDK